MGFHVTVSASARKLITDEEAQMLIKLISADFEKHPDKNAFGFSKLGVWVLKHGNELTIISNEERKKHIGE